MSYTTFYQYYYIQNSFPSTRRPLDPNHQRTVVKYYQFFPVHFSIKTIGWSEINSAIIRNYDPIGDYGGWGIKGGLLWGKKGKSVTISGDIGIQLKLKNGKLLLIGTQKKTEASKVLENYQEKIINEA